MAQQQPTCVGDVPCGSAVVEAAAFHAKPVHKPSVSIDGFETSIPHSSMDPSVVRALLTDLYQITMCYGYFKANKHQQTVTFELFFRRNPFQGEFTVYAGLTECIDYLKTFKFTEDDIAYLRHALPKTTEDAFFDYLAKLDTSQMKLYSIAEGENEFFGLKRRTCSRSARQHNSSAANSTNHSNRPRFVHVAQQRNTGSCVFPRVPLMIIQGPLGICQLVETALLNLINYSSLITTNAVRFRLAAGKEISLLEFGLRRAQGPNGAMTASKYCYVGGFDATSNVLAGKRFGIPIRGTHAHAFVSAFDLDELSVMPSRVSELYKLSCSYLDQLDAIEVMGAVSEHIASELVAFCSYAAAFPDSFLALIDTYDTLKSGVINFCAVALALYNSGGHKASGIRLDSGDLAFQSREVRKRFQAVAEHFSLPWFAELRIVASNDINEETIHSLSKQNHSIDSFGIGTHLVTCQKQPALGCVYKLVELNGQARIKLSDDVAKTTIPGNKVAYRLYGKSGCALVDLLCRTDEPQPKVGQQVLCRHPFVENKRTYVVPSRVGKLHHLYWAEGKLQRALCPLQTIRQRVQDSVAELRDDHLRYHNPTPYKVSVSESLYTFLHNLWLQNTPIGVLE